MDSLSIPSLLNTACFEFTNSVSCAWRGLAWPLRYETQSHHKSTWQCLCFHFLLRSCLENVPKRDAGESVFTSQKRVRWGDWKILNLTQIFFTIFVLQATSTYQNPVYANVKITVKDVNDNPPVFIDAPYSGEILENASLGMTVMRVTAVDKDEVKSHWYFLSNFSYWSDFDFVLWWLKKTSCLCTVSGMWFHCGWQGGLVALWISGLKVLVSVLAVSLRGVNEQNTQLL